MGMKRIPEEQIIGYVGNGVRSLMSRVLPEDCQDIDRAIGLYNEMYLLHLVERTVLYDGIDEVIRFLHGSGALLLLVTNKPIVHTERIMDYFGLTGYFRALFGGGTLSSLKPDCAVFHTLRQQFSLVPQETFMIGDSPVDAAFAFNSGIPFIFARYGTFVSPEKKAGIMSSLDASTVEDLKRIVSTIIEK
jgi:phosphoglycolate phosphatase